MNDLDIVIADGRSGDLAEVLGLLATVNLPADGVEERIGEFVVARERAGRLIACAAIEHHGSVGLLRSVAVAPDNQSLGLGTRITRAAIESAGAQGIRDVVLLTTTAREFFARAFGFTDASRADYDDRLAGSKEWTLPRCSSAAFLRLDLAGRGAKDGDHDR